MVVIDVAGTEVAVFQAECEPGNVNRWRIWCDKCRCYHGHGAGEGHRVAHCVDGYSGYYISLNPERLIERLIMERSKEDRLLERRIFKR